MCVERIVHQPRGMFLCFWIRVPTSTKTLVDLGLWIEWRPQYSFLKSPIAEIVASSIDS